MEPIAEGHYYKKQLGCQDGIIAWSHRSRFELALRLVGSSTPKLLDYGCGDGTFLTMAAGQVREIWGADVEPNQLADCERRLSTIPNVHFAHVSDLKGPKHDAAYDVVTCMETLEHCTESIVEIVLADLARLVKPDGRVIISVPIEIGPTFPLKLVLRKMAALRGLSDYKHYEKYALPDAVRMVFATKDTFIERPEYGGPEAPSHSHYGFNWRALRERVRAHLAIERVQFSPLGFLGGLVSSQAWFVCRAR